MLFSIFLFFLMLIIICDYIKHFNISVFRTINKKALITISISLIILMLFDTFNYDKIYNYNLFAEKKTCKNLLIYFSHNEKLSNFIFAITCAYSRTLYYGLAMIVAFFLLTYRKKFELEKIFLFCAIFFSIMSILHFSIDVYLASLSDYYSPNVLQKENEFINEFYYKFKTFNASNNFAYFQLLPFYAAGFRNIEIYPLILGYTYSLYILIKHRKINYKYIFISSFLGLCLFLSFSRISWVIAFVLIIFFSIINRKIVTKYLLYQLSIFIIFIVMFTYAWNYSNIIFKKDSKIHRSNFFYYTMMKVTSLINTDLSNYFNYLNKSGWYYYNLDEENFIENIENNLNDKDNLKNEEQFYEENVRAYMQQHLNSTPSRIEIYTQSSKLIKEKFFFGHTVNRFEFSLLTSDINATKESPHKTISNAESDFLQTFIEHGVFVFLLKIFLYLYLLKISLKQKDAFNCSIIIILIVFSIFVTASFYFYYWITLGVTISRSLAFNSRIEKINNQSY